MADVDESTPLISSVDLADVENSPNDTISRHEKAAWIVDETTRGATIPSMEAVPTTRRSRNLYLFFDNLSWLRQLTSALLVFLSFFELPSWCSSSKACIDPHGTSAILSGIPILPAQYATTINIILLLILIFFVVFDYFSFPVPLHTEARYLYTLLGALALDAVYVIACGGYPPIRFASFLRALLPLFYFTSLRECTMSIAAVIMPFIDVAVFVIIFTVLFGWVVALFFHDLPQADRYFGNLTVGLYSAFTSLTTADWPMQIMAVLDVSRPSAVLFVAFIVIGVFLLFNVLLAVVYNAYTGHIEELVVDKLRARMKSLSIAFDILAGDDGIVTLPDVKLLFNELRRNKRHAHLDDDRVDMLFTALDDDADHQLNREEFLEIVKVLQYKFVVDLQDISPVERYFPDFYSTAGWQNVCGFVQSQKFTYFVDAFLIFNVIVVVFETTMDLANKDTPTSVFIFSLIEAGFSGVYILEMALKISAMGFDKYWRDTGNQFDFWVTWLLLFATCLVLFPFIDNNPDIVRLFILLRCLRLITLLADIPRFRRLVEVFSILIPASVPLFSLFFLSLYQFSALGVEMFGGLIYRTNPALDPNNNYLVDAYVGNNYWSLNFNDMGLAWFTLFSSVIVAYITEVAEAIASASSLGNWTKWFFIAVFVVNVLIVSNCVIAFVVDLFVMQDETNEDDIQIAEDLQSRYGQRRIRILNQKNTADQVYAAMFRERVAEVFSADRSEA